MSEEFKGVKLGVEEAPQIIQICPACLRSQVKSYKNWTMKGRGTHRVRIFAFKCPCGYNFRVARRES